MMPSVKVGGGNRVLLQLVEEHRKRGGEVHLYHLDIPGARRFRVWASKVYSIEPRTSRTIARVIGIIRLAFRARRDRAANVVILSDPIAAIASILYRNKVRIRYVQSNDRELLERNEKLGKWAKWAYRSGFRLSQYYRYRAVLFNSEYSRRMYNSSLPLRREYGRESVINPPVFTLEHQQGARIPWSRNMIRVCCVTSRHARKGYSELVALAEACSTANVRFVALSQDELPESDAVTTLYPKTDADYVTALKSCQFILSMSTFEGFGLPLLEGMALGLVPIAVHNEGLEEYRTEESLFLIGGVREFEEVVAMFREDALLFERQSRLAQEIAAHFTVERFYRGIAHAFVGGDR